MNQRTSVETVFEKRRHCWELNDAFGFQMAEQLGDGHPAGCVMSAKEGPERAPCETK